MKKNNKTIEEFADAAIEVLRENHHSELEPFEAYAARLKCEMVQSLETYSTRLMHGYEVLLEELGKDKPSAGPSRMIRP